MAGRCDESCCGKHESKLPVHSSGLVNNKKKGVQRPSILIKYLSNKMTMSAVAWLIPSPPARVLSRKQNLVEPSSLNSST